MNISDSNIISTPRLLLRPIFPESYNRVLSSSTDTELMKFFGFESESELIVEKERYRNGVSMAGRSFLYFHLIEKETGIVMGWCGYHTWFLEHHRAELGYVLNNDNFKQKGFMSETLPLIINFGFSNMNLHRIEALIAPDNLPSLKLINRNSFIKEGILREHYFKNKIVEDSIMFSLLRSEYKLKL